MLVEQCLSVLIKTLNQFQDQLVLLTLDHSYKSLSQLAMVFSVLPMMPRKN